MRSHLRRRGLAAELSSALWGLRQLARAARARPDLAAHIAAPRALALHSIGCYTRALLLPEVPYV